MSEPAAGRAGLPAMHDPGLYRLLVVGRLGADWKDRFEGTEVTLQASGHPRGLTELTVPVSDQSSLLSVLGQLSDMQCPLLSVKLVIEGHRLDNQPTELEPSQATQEEAPYGAADIHPQP